MPILGKFGDMSQLLAEQGGVKQVDGILMDLGVSSPQLDLPHRGFSFRDECDGMILISTTLCIQLLKPREWCFNVGPLDMRMNQSEDIPTAAYIINTLLEEELARIIWLVGEPQQHNPPHTQLFVDTCYTYSTARNVSHAKLQRALCTIED